LSIHVWRMNIPGKCWRSRFKRWGGTTVARDAAPLDLV
jgi:hypothetical protein